MIKRLRAHLAAWAELYFWPLAGVLAVPAAATLAYFVTGRATQENLDWLVDLAGRALTVLVAIALVSISRQASGTWWGRDELKRQPFLYFVSTVSKLGFFWLILKTLTN